MIAYQLLKINNHEMQLNYLTNKINKDKLAKIKLHQQNNLYIKLENQKSLSLSRKESEI
jgi:hypothetical protein